MSEKNYFEIAYSLKNSDEARKMYDRWADVYDRDLTGNEYQQPVRCAKALSAQLTDKNARILDVGCGTGLSGLALREAGFQNIEGCDLSSGMLEKAKALNIYSRLFACDLNEPPIDAEDASCDALTAVGVFSFGHIMPDAVDELLRIVKRGAPLIIGLNDHYYEEGSLTTKLDQLVKTGKVKMISQQHGEHIPGNDLLGWVITFRKI